MESLNKLYFQFFERFVTPNLLKSVNEITQLLRNRTAYDVYKYLEELFSKNDNSEGYTSNQVINSLNASVSNHSSLPSPTLYQYALPTHPDHPKSAHTAEHTKNYDKPLDKTLEESMSFKNKLGIRRTLTGLAFDDPPKGYEFRNYNEDPPSLYTNPNTATPTPYAKDPLSLLPALPKLEPVFEEEVRGRAKEEEMRGKAMKEIVRKMGKIFNDNHSKIEKYNKNSGENKLFNINTSTRLEKKEESRKEYQFLTKPELQTRKY